MDPPKSFVAYGIIEDIINWRMRRAVYGLRPAPRAWGQERDSKLRQARIPLEGGKHGVFEQSHVYPSVLMLVEEEEGGPFKSRPGA